MSLVPRFVVMMITVFLKSTVRPWASVSRPSSRIWSRELKMSGWAFSISSNSTTENGLRRTFSVSWPPSSYPTYPGGDPNSRDTVCFSMYSLMSSWISESSSPNRNSASVLDSSVLPTPDGPAKMNEPPGRFGSFSPALVRRMAWDSDLIAVSCPITRLCSSSSIRSNRRDAGSGGQDLRDQLLVHLGRQVHVPGLPLLLPGILLGDQLLLGVTERGSLLEVLGVDRRLLLPPHVSDLLIVFTQVRRCGHAADAHPRASLVDQVDRLVRQEPVADVAVGKLGRGDQRVVGDRHPVMRLVAVTQALEDLDGVRDGRLGHLDRLEPALQRRVLLQVLAVLIQRGRADRLQLAPGQHRLQDRRSVDRALGGPGAHQRVQLVDEQDDVPACPDLLQDLLQPLLKITPVPRASDQRAQVQRVELLLLQGLRHLALDDLLGQPFDDSCLPDAWLADQHGIVLGAPGQHLHHPLDFLLPADHRIQLALPRARGQVPAELVQHQRRRRRRLRRRARRGRLLALVPVQQLDHLLADPVQVSTQLDQHLGGDALALADQAQQDVLGADVVVAELQGLAQRQLKDLLGTRGERNVPGRSLLPLPDDLLYLLAHGLQADPERLKGLGGYSLALVDEAEQDVLGADVVVVEHPGLFLSQDHNPPRPVGEPLEHLVAPSQSGRWGNRCCPVLPHASPRAGRRYPCDVSHAICRTSKTFPMRKAFTHIQPRPTRDVFPGTPRANADRHQSAARRALVTRGAPLT